MSRIAGENPIRVNSGEQVPFPRYFQLLNSRLQMTSPDLLRFFIKHSKVILRIQDQKGASVQRERKEFWWEFIAQFKKRFSTDIKLNQFIWIQEKLASLSPFAHHYFAANAEPFQGPPDLPIHIRTEQFLILVMNEKIACQGSHFELANQRTKPKGL